jgi:hypothetical protein
MNDAELTRLTNLLLDGELTSNDLAPLVSCVERQQGPALLRHLVDTLRGSSDEPAGVVKVMEKLEGIVGTAPVLAYTLMAVLYGVASRYRVHETCDAIDLWMVDCSRADVAESLQRLAHAAADVGEQTRYRGWADGIANRASNPQGEDV